jgi:catechol-2,3-dioxygenase
MQIKELGHVVLYVRNIEKSADFYRDILGFRELFRDGSVAAFSSGRTHHELLLIEIGDGPKAEKQVGPGLYHIGFKVGDGHEAIEEVWKELKEKEVTIVGTGDHTITHSIYILDPDGNELELYADMGDEWKKNPLAIMSATEPLRLRS